MRPESLPICARIALPRRASLIDSRKSAGCATANPVLAL